MMLDMKRTGAYVSSLRKDKDMTQVELADLLNVSHQAVSKWERGDSIPDVGTLPRLSAVFGVSIDSILYGGRSNHSGPGGTYGEGIVVRAVAEGNPERISEMIMNHELGLDPVINVAPILKASTLERITKGVTDITNEHLAGLAPFLSQECLGQLVDNLPPGDIDYGSLVSISPFIDRERLNALLDELADSPFEAAYLPGLAPFADVRHVDMMLGKVSDEELDYNLLVSIAPFVSRELLGDSVRKLGQAPENPNYITGLAPFLDRDTLEALMEGMDTSRMDMDFLCSVAPFLTRPTCDRLALGILGRSKE